MAWFICTCIKNRVILLEFVELHLYLSYVMFGRVSRSSISLELQEMVIKVQVVSSVSFVIMWVTTKLDNPKQELDLFIISMITDPIGPVAN